MSTIKWCWTQPSSQAFEKPSSVSWSRHLRSKISLQTRSNFIYLFNYLYLSCALPNAYFNCDIYSPRLISSIFGRPRLKIVSLSCSSFVQSHCAWLPEFILDRSWASVAIINPPRCHIIHQNIFFSSSSAKGSLIIFLPLHLVDAQFQPFRKVCFCSPRKRQYRHTKNCFTRAAVNEILGFSRVLLEGSGQPRDWIYFVSETRETQKNNLFNVVLRFLWSGCDQK